MDQDKLNHWNVYFNSIFLKDRDVIDISDYESIVDSGTSLMYLPPDEFDTLIDIMIENITDSCDNSDDIYFCSADIDKFPTIYFHISGKYSIEVLPENYLIEDEENYLIGITAGSSSQEYLLLGDTFMKGQYIIHDAEKY